MTTFIEERGEGLRAVVEGFRGRRILVIGDVILDQYVTGTVERISPEAPVPILKVKGGHFGLGGAANVAANITALGGLCRLVGVVGDDQWAAILFDLLERHGIERHGIVQEGDRPTTVKTRVVAGQHQLLRFDSEVDRPVDGYLGGLVVEQIEKAVEGRDIGRIAAVVIQDYDKGVLSHATIRPAVLIAGIGRPLLVDPKSRHFFAYAGAHIFKPNLRELSAAMAGTVGLSGLDLTDPVWMEMMRKRLQCTNLMVTRGQEGITIARERSDGDRDVGRSGLVHVPTQARDVYDVSGAGDTVLAVMALGVASGADLVDSAIVANVAAGLVVQKPFAATVDPEILIREFEEMA